MENYNTLKHKINSILEEIDQGLAIKDYTNSIVTLIWSEFCYIDVGSPSAEDFDGVTEELHQILEVMNPALENDIRVFTMLLSAIETYKKSVI
jgi:hypothetical protein